MPENYTTPEFGKDAFDCPRCGVYAQQYWLPFKTFEDWSALQNKMVSEASMSSYPYESIDTKTLPVIVIKTYIDEFVNFKRNKSELAASYCSHCNKYSYWCDGKLVYPAASTAPMPNSDMPEDCKKLYLEARDIADKSPRGAGALIRLCLEKLLIELGGDAKKGITENIGSLWVERKITGRVQKAADICRLNGNAFIHPSAVDMEDSAEIVLRLFKLINLIVENAITEPKELEADFGALPDSKKQEIEVRNKREAAKRK